MTIFQHLSILDEIKRYTTSLCKRTLSKSIPHQIFYTPANIYQIYDIKTTCNTVDGPSNTVDCSNTVDRIGEKEKLSVG